MGPAAVAVLAIPPERCPYDIRPGLQSPRVAAEGRSVELQVLRPELRALFLACRESVSGFDRFRFVLWSARRQLAAMLALQLVRFSRPMRLSLLLIFAMSLPHRGSVTWSSHAMRLI